MNPRDIFQQSVSHLTLFPADPPALSDNLTRDTSSSKITICSSNLSHNEETPLSKKLDLWTFELVFRKRASAQILYVFRCND